MLSFYGTNKQAGRARARSRTLSSQLKANQPDQTQTNKPMVRTMKHKPINNQTDQDQDQEQSHGQRHLSFAVFIVFSFFVFMFLLRRSLKLLTRFVAFVALFARSGRLAAHGCVLRLHASFLVADLCLPHLTLSRTRLLPLARITNSLYVACFHVCARSRVCA